MQYFVRSGALLGYADFVAELGHNPQQLLRANDLSLATLNNPDLLFVLYPHGSVAGIQRVESP